MRSDNPEFASYNQANAREPNFVVEISFDSANTDLLYLTKEAVTNLSGPNVVDGVLESISGTTQKLDPRKALSTIGSMSFSAVDDTLTATQKTKLQGGDGLRGKRVRFYVGAVGLDWSGFMLAQTQIIDTVTYKDNAYSFKCSDIQREMRKDIFDLKKTALADDLSRDDTTITVFNTNEFEMVKHPASIDGKPHKPGVEVGYLKITQGDDIEIISYEGPNTATTFTNCTRGVFNTKPLEILLPRDEFDNIDVEEDNAPKVEEYVYLELPAPMLAYALLTGSIYGELGKTLPDHWHLGISTDYVKTSDFTNIGVDWWDTTNADKGIVPVLKGLKKTDGKKFIEEQIYRMLGAFSPVYSTGEIGLKRLTVVHSVGGYVRKLDETNVVSYGELTHDMKSVINRFVITWNWVEAKQAYTRTNILIDSDSIAAHGEAEPLKLELRALASSRHSKSTLKERFDSIRDRYAGPPLRLDLTLTPDQNDLEVGDIVRVDLDAVLDYSGDETDHTLNRNFEVQQVSTDWVTGDVKVKLFGSSQKAGALTAVSAGSEVGTALTSGFWTATGTQLNNAFNPNITSSGGITTISGDITLTGNDDLTNSGAIYYCNEDLILQAGATITITKNVQIRVNGVFEINGDIDGAGNGTAGGAGVSCYREIVPGNVPNYASESLTWVPAQKFIGASSSQPGVAITTILSTDHLLHVPGGQYEGGNSVSVGLNVGQAPELTLSINDDATDILGIPSDISGQPGAGGGAIYELNYNAAPGSDDDSSGYGTHLADGGAGGAGGAGLMLITQGVVFGSGGFIDTSGGEGASGSSYVFKTSTLYSGKGAGGAPGAVYFVFTDSNANIPNINNSTLRCYFGSSDASSYSTVYNMEQPSIPWAGSGNYSFGYRNTDPSPDHTVNVFDNWKKIQFVEGVVGTVQDYPEKADDVVLFTLTEYTNTPPSQQGNISTIEVSVTAPSDPNYSYAFIQYKNALNSPWLDAGPASPEGTWQVPSDGKTYYVRALSVSKDNVMSSTGPQDSITVADVVNDPDTEAPTVMTFDNITVTCESGGATFTGKDAKFSWTDTNKDKLHFLEYKVEIKDGSANLMRTERTKDAFYVYTYEKNKEDYEAFNASAGANRSITITVTVVGALDITGGKYEGPTDSLSVSNPAPAAVGSLVVSPGYGVIYVNGTNPTDLDFTRFGIYISQTSGFTAGPSNFLGYANQLPITIASDENGDDLASGATYYLRLESYDEFGAGSITTDYSALMAGVPAATEIPVNETLTVDGRIIADASGDPYNVVMGPQTVDSRAALFNFKNTTTGTHYFALFEDGTVEVNGKITIGSGSSGISSFSDAGALATADNVSYSSVTGTKPPTNADNTASNTSADTSNVNGVAASTISTGAQRANSGLNSSGQVTQIIKGVNLPSTGMSTGLNLTSTYMGYYNGSSWGSYIQSNGNFHFGGSGSNYIEWNGSTLTMVGDFQTATSGQRIELDNSANKLMFKDSSGITRVDIDDGTSIKGYIDISATSTKMGLTIVGAKYGIDSDGSTWGVLGSSASGSGVRGTCITSSGKAIEGLGSAGYGGYFTNSSSSIPTIYASNSSSGNAITAAGGTGYGVYATSSGSSKAAVYGVGSSSTAGVAGDSNSGRGVQGKALGGYGVWGEATSTSVGVGVYGHGGDYGGQFDAPHSGGHGVHAQGATYGGWLHGGTYDAFLANTGTAGSFTGAHDSLFPKSSTAPELGDIVVRTGVAYKESVSSTIHYVDRCAEVESKKTYGVVSNFLELEDYNEDQDCPITVSALTSLTQAEYEALQTTHKRAIVNGIGEGQINVCDDNGNIEDGDLICTSLTPGKGQLYTGNDSRVIVAQACEGVDWSQETETTKMIACIYMCS